ncbi:MAG: 4'-phosphopantetheinyl transferase superfamily protein [Acetatifactor sp.]|nr:4'-phosphopantetheinyl transferase superfamily protein [Acetatifactor sp.]
MWKACYLLDMGQEQAMMQEMEALLDRERLLKYQGMKVGRAKALCLGAGVLLRLAWAESQSGLLPDESKNGFFRDKSQSGREAPQILTPSRVVRCLRELPKCPEPRYRHGEKGKPYFEDSQLSFSLSHSGDLVLCAIADHEIGADLQMITEVRWEQLAERYYSTQEQDYLGIFAEKRAGCFRPSETNARLEFFSLWCRKEAYGKMTGDGLAPYLGRPILEEEAGISIWEGQLDLRDETYCYCITEQDARKLIVENLQG